MPSFSNDWGSSQLAEFVDVLSSCETEASAIQATVERAAEALEAEVAAALSDEGIVACVGFRAGQEPVDAMMTAAVGETHGLDVPGVGTCWTMAAPVDDAVLRRLLVARSGDADFSYQEATLLRGMGRALVLSLRMLRTIEKERSLRQALQEHQTSLERLSRIQTSISRRVPLQEVLDAVTIGAEELLGADLASIRLLDPAKPGHLRMVSASGVKVHLMDAEPSVAVGDGVGGRAVSEDRVVVMNDYSSNPDALVSFASDKLSAAMGAPVHENGVVTGSLVVGTYDRSRTYTQAEQDLLMALAEHASLAIMDAKMVDAVKDAEQKVIQAQKMEAVGQLAGGIAHDFNNLLFVIRNCAQFLSQSIFESDPRRRDVDEIIDAADRAATLTRQLLTFSRRQVIAPQVVDVNQLVSEIEKLLRRTITHNVELETHLEAVDAWTIMDPGQLEQVLMNLAVNAKDAMPRGGLLHISTKKMTVDRETAESRPGLEPGTYVLLELRDTGTGMDEETRQRVFEPFFTTKPIGEGTGLGLATVYGIVKRVGGYVEVASEVGEGTTFGVYLPVSLERPMGSAPEEDPVPEPSTRETILVAEDENAVRKLVCRQLRNAGYEVLDAGTGEEALELFKASSDRVGLLLTDVIMPKVSGRELAERIIAIDPSIKVIFMSGYTDEVIAKEGILEEGQLFIQKPFSARELLEKLQEVFTPSQ